MIGHHRERGLLRAFTACTAALAAFGVAAQAEADTAANPSTGNVVAAATTVTVHPNAGATFAVTAQGSSAVATVPVQSATGVRVTTPTGTGSFTIGLPGGGQAVATQTSGDTTTYSQVAPATDLVAEAQRGGLRLSTVLSGPSAPTSFSYPLTLPAGAALVATNDGGAVVQDSDGSVAAVIAPPWAHDANGQAVPTSYTISGATLTQTVTPGSTAAYPIVADPSISFGATHAVITLKAKDQRILLSGAGPAIGALAGALACSEGGPAAAVCAAVGAFLTGAVTSAISQYGVSEKCDVVVTISYFKSGFLGIPYPAPHISSINRTCH